MLVVVVVVFRKVRVAPFPSILMVYYIQLCGDNGMVESTAVVATAVVTAVVVAAVIGVVIAAAAVAA